MAVAAIRVEQRAPIAIVALAGEHDTFTAGQLQKELRSVAATVPVVVDLSEATFLDSTTIGVLLDARRAADSEGLALVVDEHSGAHVIRLLRTTRLDTVFDVYASRDEAVAALSGR